MPQSQKGCRSRLDLCREQKRVTLQVEQDHTVFRDVDEGYSTYRAQECSSTRNRANADSRGPYSPGKRRVAVDGAETFVDTGRLLGTKQ